jgi:hypothetical protein
MFVRCHVTTSELVFSVVGSPSLTVLSSHTNEILKLTQTLVMEACIFVLWQSKSTSPRVRLTPSTTVYCFSE